MLSFDDGVLTCDGDEVVCNEDVLSFDDGELTFIVNGGAVFDEDDMMIVLF